MIGMMWSGRPLLGRWMLRAIHRELGPLLRDLPGVFCAGEMLDWEAPTGGYLLTACFATGHAAGQGARTWLGRQS